MEDRTPLYLPIERAAAYAGVSEHMMRSWANDPVRPIPHLRSGNKRLVRVSAIGPYAITREEPCQTP